MHKSDSLPVLWRELRDHCPLAWTEPGSEPGFWSVTRHSDSVRILKDYQTFSSEQPNVLGPQRASGDPGVGQVMNAADPPRHSEFRRIVSRCFTPRAIGELEQYVRTVTRDLLADALDLESCNIQRLVATLPVASVSALLGVPLADWKLMLDMTSAACGTHGETAVGEAARTAAAHAHGQLMLYFRDQMSQRRRAPTADVISILVAATDAGQITETEALLFIDLLILGGNETTRHAATGAVLALARFPGELALLAGQPGRRVLDCAVEEVLRWTTPSKHVIRRARTDVELHGQTIRAGEDTVIWFIAANGDEREFADPERLDLRRTPNNHLALGAGTHFCLGSSLAKLELRVFLEEFAAQVHGIDVTVPPQPLASATINGLSDLYVRLEG